MEKDKSILAGRNSIYQFASIEFRLVIAFFCAMPVFRNDVFVSVAAGEESTKPAASAERPSAASREEIGRWIEDLGHDAYTVRQAAASRLIAAGVPARESLATIVDGPDPEVRAAAQRLIALIDRTEFRRRLEAFAADIDGRQGLSLPGWEAYQKLAGTSAAARSLFVDMYRHEGTLLAGVFGGRKQVARDLLESRLMRQVQLQLISSDRTAAPPLASCAAIVFVATAPEANMSDHMAVLIIENVIQRSPIVETLRPDSNQEAVRRLVIGWLLNCKSKNEGLLARRLTLISNAELADALPVALAVVSAEPPYQHVQSTYRAAAALIVGQLGKREDIERLEPLLENVSICTSPQMQVQGQPAGVVQVRDVALVAMLQLTGQRPADYGYVNARQQSKAYELVSLFRENNQQRAEAIAKWRQWRASQKGASAKAN
jgi:hypothetical protein